MLKKALILALVVVAGIVVVQIVMVWPIIFPEKAFMHQQQYRQFNIYSDQTINENILQIFDDVAQRLERIEIYNTESTFDVFLCYNPDLYEVFAKKVKKTKNSQGFNVQFLKYTFISVSFIETINKRNSAGHRYNILEGDISHIIAHELIHELLDMRIGSFKSRSLADWKKEGLCEYAASISKMETDSTYSFKNVALQYFNGSYDNVVESRKYYILSKILVEYLLAVKNITFEELIKGNFSETILKNEIKYWARNFN